MHRQPLCGRCGMCHRQKHQEQGCLLLFALLQTIPRLAAAFLGLALEFQFSETQCEARRYVAAVQHLAGAVAAVVRVGVGGAGANRRAPVEDVLYVDEHR